MHAAWTIKWAIALNAWEVESHLSTKRLCALSHIIIKLMLVIWMYFNYKSNIFGRPYGTWYTIGKEQDILFKKICLHSPLNTKQTLPATLNYTDHEKKSFRTCEVLWLLMRRGAQLCMPNYNCIWINAWLFFFFENLSYDRYFMSKRAYHYNKPLFPRPITGSRKYRIFKDPMLFNSRSYNINTWHDTVMP